MPALAAPSRSRTEPFYRVRHSGDVHTGGDGVVPADVHTTGLGILHRKPPQSEGSIVTDGIKPPAGDISVEEVYRAPEFGTVELTSALALLRDAIEWCNLALAALARSEPLQ